MLLIESRPVECLRSDAASENAVGTQGERLDALAAPDPNRLVHSPRNWPAENLNGFQ